MFAFMPSLRTALQRFVIIFFRFFDQPFKADVAAHFITVLIKRKQREQA